MMIITRILFIYLVFYSTAFAKNANEFFVTFEMMKGSSEYMDIMQNKMQKYEQRGLKCYIEDMNPIYSLRCNDTKTLKDYKESKELLDGLNLHYKIVPIHEHSISPVDTKYKKIKIKEKKKSNSLTLGDGYRLYNQGKYKQAQKVFEKLYKNTNNLDTSYAMALVALKTKKYPKVREYLAPYRTHKKADKLIYDSIVSEYYTYVKYGNTTQAISLKNRYKNRYPALNKLPSAKPKKNLGDGYKAYNAKQYEKAKAIFTTIYKEKPDVESAYAMALVALHEKNYPLMREYLKHYIIESKKANKLYYDSIVSEYYAYLNSSRETEALKLQSKFLPYYPKLKSLAKPKPKINLGDGYKAYNAKNYKKATKIFSSLYKQNPNADTSYAMSLLALNKQNFPLVRAYLKPYRKKDKKASKLYYDSIVYQYQALLGEKKDKEALALIKKYKKEYPALKKLPKPNSGINLGTGYKAYNAKNYDKARRIFFKLYNKKQDEENSYAVALILLHDGEFDKLKRVLEPFRTKSDKVSKLYYDSLVTEYYALRDKGEKTQANLLIKKYSKIYPKLNKFNEDLLADANKYIAAGDYLKAEEYLDNNGYENASDYIFEKKYEKALQLRSEAKDFEAINLILPYVSTKPKASQLYIDISLALSGLYLENKNYSRAKYLLKPIAGSSKKAEALYYKIIFNEDLQKGWDSFNKRKRRSSLKYFEDACKISPDTKCQEGIMNASFTLKDYKKAYKSAVEVYEKNTSPDAALIAYSSAVNLGDKKESAYWYELLSNENKKIALYRINAKDVDPEYLNKLYEDAIEVNNNDFELVTNYLYFLKDAKYDDKFEEVMHNALNYYSDDTQQHILHRIKREYQNAKLYEYYKTKQNEACFKYGNKILKEKDDVSYKRMHAWCAYKSKNYKSAEKIFSSINAKYGVNPDDVYGQFISAYNDKNYNKAKKLLAYLAKRSNNDKDRAEIANYYISMNELEKAQKIVSSLQDEEQRDKLQKKINLKYKYSRNEYKSFSGGIFYKKRSIADDLHSFEQVILPIDADWYTKNWGHYYFDLDIMGLTDTFTGSPDYYTLEQALAEKYDTDVSTTNSVIMPKVGGEWKYLSAEIGSTPMGATISPELLGKLSLHTANEDWNVNVNLVKTAIDDSMISFVGDSRVSQDVDIEYGRVTKSGVEVGFAYNDDLTYTLDIGVYPDIVGLNVVDNSEVKGVGSITYHMPTAKFSYLDYGILAVYDSYDVSSDSYTYGNGAYFSPQSFLLTNFIVEIADMKTNNFYWKAKLSLGFESFSVDDQLKYPLDDAVTATLSDSQRNEVVDGYDESGVTYKVAAGAGYKISKKLDLVAGFSFEEMKEFRVIEAGISLVYCFTKSKKVNLYNFHHPHRLDSALR